MSYRVLSAVLPSTSHRTALYKMPMFGWNSQDGEKDPSSSDQGPRSPTEHLSDASTHSQHSTPRPGEREVTPDATKTRPSDAVVDPALIDQNSGNSLSSFAALPPHNVDNSTTSFPPHHSSMPHRVEPMNTTHRHHPYDHSHRRPSPPPIATLTHSPSPSVVSLDRSSVSTPPTRRSPPHRSMESTPLYSAPYHPGSSMMQSSRHQSSHFARGSHVNHEYMYTSHFPDHRYESEGTHSPYNNSSGLPAHFPPPMHASTGQQARENYGNHPYPLPGQPNGTIGYTDDAATKLSDRVRRRCFNCSTTDTSTWRRSNLSPGKVLCNKCGLFERTHSRPRPEQFPHKRGPIPGVSIRGRTPPAQLPPISPPYQYSHPSIAPLSSSTQEPRREYQTTTLPGLQSWHDSGNHRMPPPPTARRTLEPNPHGRQPSPPAPRSQLSSQQETRDTPNARESTA
ncbi:hypothetical protein BD779DRAFT_1676558 [Infundibulicybe gibba]|nr:hypothetical protein BD779DRAFT_1676558 [Infundibulicybe gibba]